MERKEVRALLEHVVEGRETVETALSMLTANTLWGGVHDLGFARLDTDRAARTGDAEVVYGAGKTPEQLVAIVRALKITHDDRPVLVTRVTAEGLEALSAAFPGLTNNERAACVMVGEAPAAVGRVAVLSAGTSDGSVAAEAAFVARASGVAVTQYEDVGVAGIHRLLQIKTELDDHDCLVVVAGMEGALPSVVGGLTGVPLVAVPTSVGYGTAFQGLTALFAMLNSCAPGVVVSNIDNGFGAGLFAARVARRAGRNR
ncbi:nickel pincer cofactor biosynthesis protein LarB [Streptomyces sp. NPDC046994]|uniref:nickel pincer cofactor biosynthesis protein LarB n=1 Tax=Streptomyces sp. NPDC046994 TaxID=3155735 RepID=UPI00345656E3